MKRIAFIFYSIFFLMHTSAFGQTKVDSCPKLEGKQLTGNITYNDTIRFTVQAMADSIVCYQISLEKKINAHWTIYTNDVFASKDMVICAPANYKDTFAFLISSNVEVEVAKDGTMSAVVRNENKIGLFRLKINYGNKYDNLTDVMYLPEFRIIEPHKKN